MQTGKVVYQNTYLNEFSFARAQNAIDVLPGPGGVPTCRSVIGATDLNCVPYNIWTLGGVTPAALNYISTPGLQSGSTDHTLSPEISPETWADTDGSCRVRKAAFRSRSAREQRTEKLQLATDVAFQTNDLAGQGGPTIGVVGKYTVKDIFAELRVPIIEGGTMAHLLSFNGSVRRSDYSIGQKTDSYGLGLEYAPVVPRACQFPARGTGGKHSRVVRCARQRAVQHAVGSCAGPTPTASLAACQRTGVTAAQYGRIIDSPAGQYNALGGGNPNLRPETADSTTFGLVFEPMRNLTASIDVFDIKLKDVISTLPPVVVVQTCLTTGQFCNLIQRDIIGSLWAQTAGAFWRPTSTSHNRALPVSISR